MEITGLTEYFFMDDLHEESPLSSASVDDELQRRIGDSLQGIDLFSSRSSFSEPLTKRIILIDKSLKGATDGVSAFDIRATKIDDYISYDVKTLVQLGKGGFGDVWGDEARALKRARSYRNHGSEKALRAERDLRNEARYMEQIFGEKLQIAAITSIVQKKKSSGEIESCVKERLWLESKRAIGSCQDVESKERIIALSYPERIDLCLEVINQSMSLHFEGLVHGDHKPENLLLYDEEKGESLPSIRLADFGSIREFKDQPRKFGTCTPSYCLESHFELFHDPSLSLQAMQRVWQARECHALAIAFYEILFSEVTCDKGSLLLRSYYNPRIPHSVTLDEATLRSFLQQKGREELFHPIYNCFHDAFEGDLTDHKLREKLMKLRDEIVAILNV